MTAAVVARPFLRWAGGKTQLLPELLARVPEKFGRYYEPFVGGGALFFALRALCPKMQEATLSDSNGALMTTYTMVRNWPNDLIASLKRHALAHSEKHYYAVREKLGYRLEAVDDAADFIYMNKAGFNGLYRVNRKGEFNVPWGKRARFEPDEENIHACSKALAGINLIPSHFAVAAQACKGDFVYFDPPYVPASATSNFTAYQKEPFGPEQQKELRDFALTLKKRGVHVMLSNSDTSEVRHLYNGPFRIERVEARRNINSKGSARGPIGELIIT